MVGLKFLLLFLLVLSLFTVMTLTFGYHLDYSELNKLESRLTSEIRHPQHITHSRYLIRTNIISNYKCIAKIDGGEQKTHSKMGMVLCSEVAWWKFYK